MSVCEIWQATFQNPDTFWTAVGSSGQAIEAIIVFFSAFVIIFQLRQMRQASIENKIAGLKAALDELRRDPFDRVSRLALSGGRIEAVDWHSVLEQVNTVAHLISEGYTDRDLLLRLKAQDLVAVGEQLQIHRDLATNYAQAFSLLESARRHIEGKSR